MKTLIKNGWIHDGTLENVPFSGDVLVSGDRIEAVAPRIECEDAQIINAAGRVVCPGFIDVHRHADLAVFRQDSADFGAVELAQGLTSIGMGVCGFSFAPYTDNSNGLYPYTVSTHGPSVDGARYPTMEDYLQALRHTSLPVNVSTLQGLAAIRLAIKGYAPDPFTDEELALSLCRRSTRKPRS